MSATGRRAKLRAYAVATRSVRADVVYPWPHWVWGWHGWQHPPARGERGNKTVLCADATLFDVGTMLAAVAGYNGVEPGQTVTQALGALIEASRGRDGLVVSGGVELARGGEVLLSPGCCCGVESWSEWLTAPRSRQTPWCGHSPDWELEHRPGGVIALRAWEQDQALVERDELEQAVVRIEPALRGFLAATGRFADEVAPWCAREVVEVVRRVMALPA